MSTERGMNIQDAVDDMKRAAHLRKNEEFRNLKFQQQKKKKEADEKASLEREKRMQKAIIGIKNRFGKNAILKGMNLQEGATAKDRNEQIGGHKA